MSRETPNEWKEKYQALVEVIRGTMGETVLTTLVSVAERNRARGKTS